MPANDKWAQYEVASPAAKHDKWSQYEAAPATTVSSAFAPDLTTNTIDPATGTGYGLYRMGSYDFNAGQVSKPEIQVPYNRVQDAIAAGYKLHPDEAPRYQRDTAHNGSVSRATGQVKSLLARMTETMPDTPLEGNWWQKANAAAANVEKLPFNVTNRTLRGLAGLPAGLAQTATGISHGDSAALESLDPAAMGENSYKGLQQDTSDIGPMAALGNLGGDALTAYATGKLGGKVADTGIAAAEGTGDAAQSIVRRMAGSGPGVARALVREATEDNRQIALRNADKQAEAMDKWHEAQTKADYDHRADLLKLRQQYAQSVRDATEKARTGTAKDRAEVQSKNLAAKQKYEQDVRDAQQKYATDRAEALRANAEAQRALNQKVGQTAQQNRAATAAERAKVDQEGKLQVGGSQLIYGLQQLDKALRDRAGTMFDAVREKVGTVTRPGTDLGTRARAALTKISGSSTVPKPFSDILGKYPETEPEFIEYQGAQIPKTNRLYDVLKQQGMGAGAPPVTFGDLQGYYTETGAELSKGTLPGDVYLATKELHNAIGDMMQEMASGAGAGKEFWDSRVFYRNYMDTFHEPTGPSGSGSPVAQALLAKDPAVAVEKFAGDAGDRGIAVLRRYSDSLANLAQNVRRTAREKVTVPARKSAVDIPAPKATPVPAGANLPLPGVVESLPAARAANLALPPVLPDDPVVPFHDPKLTPPRTISAEEIQRRNAAGIHSRAQGMATRLLGWTAIWPAFRILSELTRTGSASLRPLAAIPAAGAAGLGVESLLEYPPVMDFLTRATPRQIATIPPELRGSMPEIINEAKARGVKISPILATWAVTVQRNRAGQTNQQSSQQVQQPDVQGAIQ
jgi:hypothetical protein